MPLLLRQSVKLIRAAYVHRVVAIGDIAFLQSCANHVSRCVDSADILVPELPNKLLEILILHHGHVLIAWRASGTLMEVIRRSRDCDMLLLIGLLFVHDRLHIGVGLMGLPSSIRNIIFCSVVSHRFATSSSVTSEMICPTHR